MSYSSWMHHPVHPPTQGHLPYQPINRHNFWWNHEAVRPAGKRSGLLWGQKVMLSLTQSQEEEENLLFWSGSFRSHNQLSFHYIHIIRHIYYTFTFFTTENHQEPSHLIVVTDPMIHFEARLHLTSEHSPSTVCSLACEPTRVSAAPPACVVS